MSRRTEDKAALEGELLRAAREHLKRTSGGPGPGKPGGKPRENRPKLRGAPAQAAVIEDRR